MLDPEYWNQRYVEGNTGWDLNGPSPPLIEYCRSLNDRSISILIPGAGNSHEVKALLELGFENIHVVDFARAPIERLEEKYKQHPEVTFFCQDFFDHAGQYDLILEQTFFCALDPPLRVAYVEQMDRLLASEGCLVGVLFGVEFEKEGPPFGGSLKEYQELFSSHFNRLTLEPCRNSIGPRIGNELFIRACR